jgi:hypothetical protein
MNADGSILCAAVFTLPIYQDDQQNVQCAVKELFHSVDFRRSLRWWEARVLMEILSFTSFFMVELLIISFPERLSRKDFSGLMISVCTLCSLCLSGKSF